MRTPAMNRPMQSRSTRPPKTAALAMMMLPRRPKNKILLHEEGHRPPAMPFFPTSLLDLFSSLNPTAYLKSRF